MFRALDSAGRVKILPAGSSFSNPLAVTNGGTGLVQISDGELYVPTVASAMARLPRVTVPNKVLAKYASETSPNWKSIEDIIGPYYIPQIASRPTTGPRVFSFSAAGNASIGSINVYGGSNMLDPSGITTYSDGSDAVGAFLRMTTGAANGNVAGVQFNTGASGSQGMSAFNNEFLFVLKLRTGSDITSVRLQAGFGTSYPANSDAQANLGAGMRYSTPAGDTSWNVIYGNGSTGAQLAVPSGISVVASTVYTFSIRTYISGQFTQAEISINGTVITTIAVPVSTLIGTFPYGYCGVATQVNSARAIDLARMTLVARHQDQLY
jgi:hypothetical protein